jgi:hypothetical protein
MEITMTTDERPDQPFGELPGGPSDEDLGVLPPPPPYRFDHFLWLQSVIRGDTPPDPQLLDHYIRLLNDRNVPLIRHYGSQLLGVTKWTPAAEGRLVDWLCATDRTLSDWEAQKLTLAEWVERLQAAVAELERKRSTPHALERKQTKPRVGSRPNEKRDEWVFKQRQRNPPRPWEEILENLEDIAHRRGWQVPRTLKALQAAFYRYEERKRPHSA